MGRFWVTWLLTIITASAGSNLSSNLTNIIGNNFQGKAKLVECLQHINSLRKTRYLENIAIRLKAESIDTRRDFLDTIENIYSKFDMIPIELDADESVSYYIRLRIYFIDSVNSLQFLINRERKWNAESLAVGNKYFLVLPRNMQNPGPLMEQMFDYLWNVSIINTNIITEDSTGVVTFYTNNRFNERSCNDRTPIVRNRFINGRFELKTLPFLSKTKNFWKCPIKYIYWEQEKDSTKTDENIVAILSEKMNFTLEKVHSRGQLGTFDAYGKTFSGAFKMLKENRGDVVSSICNPKSRRFFSSPGPHRYIHVLLISRWPEDYMPLEILFFPFDIYTWLALLVFFAAKAMAGLLWKRIPMAHNPHRNFIVQMHIIPWIFSILILRSSYEGSIFKFLSQRIRRPPPKNIDEAIKQDFKFIVHPRLYEQLIALDELKENLVVIDASFEAVLDLLDKSDRKYALIDLEDNLVYFAKERTRRRNYFIGKDFIQFYLECFYMSKYSYFTQEFNYRLGLLSAHGYLSKLFPMSAMVRGFRKNVKETSKGEQAVLAHLLGTFQLLLVLLGASLCIFVLELLSRRSQRLRIIMDLLH